MTDTVISCIDDHSHQFSDCGEIGYLKSLVNSLQQLCFVFFALLHFLNYIKARSNISVTAVIELSAYC